MHTHKMKGDGGMECRRMKLDETEAVRVLWQETFGDTKQEATNYLLNFVGPDNIFLALHNGRVCAMLSAVPCTLLGQKGVYFFALATAKEHRGKGVMQTLMQCAKENCKRQGATFCCLVPASRSLFFYYEKNGFQTLYQRRAMVDLPSCEKGYKRSTLNVRNLLFLRQQFAVTNCVVLQENSMQLALEELLESGYRLVENEAAYAVYAVGNNSLLVPELYAETQAAALALLGAVGGEVQRVKAVVHLSIESDFFTKNSFLQEAASFVFFEGKDKVQLQPRMHFALDALFEKDFDSP